jgi:uncharacterized protein (DUF433 family)
MTNTLVIQDPDILSGTPVFYGTRVPVKNLLDYLASGDTLDEFLEDFPSVKREIAMMFLEQIMVMIDENFQLLL